MRHRHYAWTLVIALSFLVATVACQQAAAPAQEINVGIGLPLSGSGAPTGILLSRTFEMAAADIGVFDVGGKKYKWNLNALDNLYSSAGGVATANKFINQIGVKFMHQFGSGPGTAVQPLAEGSKVIFDSAASDRTFLGEKFKYTFRSFQTPVDTFPAVAAYLQKNQPQTKRWYVFVADDVTGDAYSKTAQPIIAHYGLTLAGETRYPRETTDFYPLLVKVLPTKPDLIFTQSADAVGTLVKQAREQGYTGTFLLASMPPALVPVAGPKAAEGILMPAPDMWSDQSPKAINDFAAKFKSKYGEEFTGSGMIALPTLYMFTEAMKKAGTADDTDKIVQAMESQKMDTPLGTLFYGGKEIYGVPHQLRLPVWISQLKDGKPRTIATVSIDDAAKASSDVFK